MEDQILDMLMKKDEITWQDLIHNLIKSEQMNPWDVDLSLLSKRYIEILKQLQEINFFVSGKVVLAAAILLKIKANKLLNQEFADFDNLLFSSDENEEDAEQGIITHEGVEGPKIKLTIKTPQLRKRKVSLKDLIGALEKALDVDERRIIRRERFDRIPETIKIPERKLNLGEKIRQIHDKIKEWFTKNKSDITFNQLLSDGSKIDKVYTFMPLLHLENHNKIVMKQPVEFENIYIQLLQELEKNEGIEGNQNN